MHRKSRMISFKVETEKFTELAEDARKTGQTIAGLVRQMVYKQLEQQKTA